MNRTLLKWSHLRLLLLSAVLFLATVTAAQATHYVAGEITYRSLGDGLYEIQLVTYTDTDTRLDHPTALIVWGDGDSSEVPRSQKDVNFQNRGVDRNIYIATHRYDPGTFLIGFFDRNRIRGIENIDNSVDQAFYVDTRLTVESNLSENNSPVLQQPPLDRGCTGQVFEHNPTAYDPDGDSLAYELVPPRRNRGTEVSGYINLQDSVDYFNIDPVTGQFEWEVPEEPGIYNIALLIKEYRDGRLIGYVLRDMQINIKGECQNRKPDVFPVRDTCVEAGRGNILDLTFRMTDPDTAQQITLSAFGSPLEAEFVPQNTASLTPPEGSGSSPDTISANFRWQIACSHVRKEPYRIVVRGEDNVRPATEELVDLETFTIRVIGPPPENLVAQARGDAIALEWQPPVCDNILGYFVYRAIAPTGFDTSFCEVGIPPDSRFRQIAVLPGSDSTTFVDDNDGAGLSLGTNYCYRITAVYQREGEVEFIEGYASNEACARLRFDRPILTQVDVDTTAADQGRIHLQWANPTELDTTPLQNYRYELLRVDPNQGDSIRIYTVESPTFSGLRDALEDTTFVDRNLNTQDLQYSYLIHFTAENLIGERQDLGYSPSAESLFLTVNFGDEELFLSWSARTTWQNDSFLVLREQPPGSRRFADTLGTVQDSAYTDSGLINNRLDPYCYKIVSYGSFGIEGISEPTENRSQVACGVPQDTIAPCPPDSVWGSINCNCETGEFPISLYWRSVNSSDLLPECGEDIVAYEIYFGTTDDPTQASVVRRLDLVEDLNQETPRGRLNTSLVGGGDFNAAQLPGYFFVRAIDSFENRGRLSAPIPLECEPQYALPNIFTPNGDAFNEQFRPMESCFIESVDMNIYNRWNQLVYETSNPEILWDGVDAELENQLEAGTYFYECEVRKRFLDGIQTETLRGTITIAY